MTHERSQLGSGFERFEEAFRQAAEKDRLAACAPQSSAATARFPRHEIVERLPGSIGDEFDDCGVVDEAEKRRLVRD